MKHNLWVKIAIASTILLLALAVRMDGLAARTINHIEVYVAGDAFPADLSLPIPRVTILDHLGGILAEKEPHPPAYYVLMLAWTKLLGTGIVALRLPSVLFGVAAVLLVYILGSLERDWVAGALAAGLLALNGVHVLWSQIAKVYAMACFLSLFSTVLLFLACTSRRRQWLLLVLYLGATLAGLATSIWFWPLLVTHMLWVLANDRTHESMPQMLRWQFVTLVLASPLISLAIFVSSRPGYSEHSLLTEVIHLLQFGFLFEPDPFSSQLSLVPVIATVLLVPIALLLLRFGLLSCRELGLDRPISREPPLIAIVLASAFSCAFILRLGRFAIGFDPAQARLVAFSSVIPIALAGLYFLLRGQWRHLQKLAGFWRQKTSARLRLPTCPSHWLATLPVGMLLLVFPVVPLFQSRGLLVFIPYLILVLSKGLVSLVRRSQYWVALVVILFLVHPLSIVYFGHSYHVHTEDYKGLAEQWLPQIQEDDLIFVQRHWMETPIFYYVRRDDHNFVRENYAEAIRMRPDSRVWVISGKEFRAPEAAADAVAGLDYQESITARWLQVDLYVPSDPTQ